MSIQKRNEMSIQKGNEMSIQKGNEMSIQLIQWPLRILRYLKNAKFKVIFCNLYLFQI